MSKTPNLVLLRAEKPKSLKGREAGCNAIIGLDWMDHPKQAKQRQYSIVG